MDEAKTFTRGWSIHCSQVGVDKQGRRHQWNGTEADKGASGEIYRRGPSRITENGAINIAIHSTST